MILPDVNVLVHAYNSDSPMHSEAQSWWEKCLAGPEGVGLAWVVLLGFLRITTHRKIIARPLPLEEALSIIRGWLALPHIHIPHPSDQHFDRFADAISGLGTAGNLTTDAHLATLAMERGYVLYSMDNDFARFPGLRWVNPCR